METLKENKGLVAVAILLALVVGASVYNSSNDDNASNVEASQAEEAQTDNDQAESAESSDTADSTDSDQSATYDYVAQPGDSYSVLARKAVQTYGIVNDVRLSHAEILAAETKLTQDAGEQYLNQGQAVSLSIAEVKAAMDYAQDLSDDEKAAWATYVPYVDFDTRQYGE